MSGTRHNQPQGSRRGLLKAGMAVAAVSALGNSGTAEAKEVRTVSQSQDAPLVRQNVKSLSDRQKRALVEAIHRLKRTQSPIDPTLNYYDQFVRFHQLALLRSRLELGHSVAHQSPAFLPWHRKLILMFEQAVRDTTGDPNFTVPYWDWTDQSSLDVVFDDDLMGPAEGDPEQHYAILSGPFRRGKFAMNLTASAYGHNDFQSRCPFPYLTRGEKGSIPLPTAADVSALLKVDIYDSPPYDATANIHKSFRNYLLGAPDPTASPSSLQGMSRLHRLPHLWVGGQWDATVYSEAFKPSTTTFVGTMTAIDCSPNDPVFWLHHCNIDRLWAIWETVYGSSYEPTSGANLGWNIDDELYPYVDYRDSPEIRRNGITNRSMLDFTRFGYTYEDLT